MILPSPITAEIKLNTAFNHIPTHLRSQLVPPIPSRGIIRPNSIYYPAKKNFYTFALNTFFLGVEPLQVFCLPLETEEHMALMPNCTLSTFPVKVVKENFLIVNNKQEIVVVWIHRDNILLISRLHEDFTSHNLALIAKIIQIIPYPVLTRKLDTPLKIGADIEFSIIDSDGIFHSATEFFADNTSSSIGTDGNVETLEIRPDPVLTPAGLCENIINILKNINQVLPPGYDLHGGGGGDVRRSTGLHIHFSGTLAEMSSRRLLCIATYTQWLETFIGQHLQQMPGARRADLHYATPGDFRCRDNHGEFSHQGWEWRTLPTVMNSPAILQAILSVAFLVVRTANLGKELELGEFDKSWYLNLPGASDFKREITIFWNFIQERPPININVLNAWLAKPSRKDAECDVKVSFSDTSDFLSIAPFVMYNPQKLFDSITIHAATKDKYAGQIILSSNIPQLQQYIISTYGITTLVIPNHKTRHLDITVGLNILLRLAKESRSSRNRIKMFTQEIIKHI